MKRVKSGIKGLDPHLHGGFRPKSNVLVLGGPGSGKTIFALQFLMKGLRDKESCLYISLEKNKEKVYDEAKEMGWDLGRFEKANKLFFLEQGPEQIRSIIEEGGGTLEQVIAKHRISRVAIDPITGFSLLFESELARKQAGSAFLGLVNSWGCSAVITAQASLRDGQLWSGTLEHEADAVIALYYLLEKKRRKRYLEVVKMRGSKHSSRLVSFSVGSRGLRV